MVNTTDAPLLDRTDSNLARPLPFALEVARADIRAACEELLTVPETALSREDWDWIGGSKQEIRYGAYRAAEALEEAETAAASLVATDDATETLAARIVGKATSARWDLLGLLLPLKDEHLDADPGNGEWPIRLVMGHVISGQRAYGWGTAWWVTNPFVAGDPAMPPGIPDEMWETLPSEETAEAAGSVVDLAARFDAVLDLGAERLAGLPDEQLELGARWMRFPITIGFRLGRWSSHIREHTLQVEKTLAMLGHAPGEPQRLVRHVLSAYGRAEAAVFGRRLSSGVEDAASRISQAAADARAAIGSSAGAARNGSG